MPFYFQTNEWGERYIPDVNRDTFVAQSSTSFYATQLDADLDLDAPDTLYVVIGTDSGLLFDYLATQALAAGTAIVLVEDDSVYPHLSVGLDDDIASTRDNQSTVHAGVSMLTAGDWQAKVFDGNDRAWFLSGDVKLIQANCCVTDQSQRYLPLFREARVAIDERRVDLQQRCGRKPFIDVQMENAVDNVTVFPADEHFGRGKVAMVLGGGPSLDEHLAWVQSNRDKLFIIAVSRLCEALQSRDLLPDLVVSIDPQDYMYKISKHGTQWSNVPLVNSYHLTPQLLQQWRGPHYFLGERLPWDGLDESSTGNVAYTGATVSHTALIIAARLGFSTILMAGMDFCFSRAGGSHASGTPEAALQLLPWQADAQIVTYNGRTASTSMALYRCIDDLRALGDMINQKSPVLFNLSGDAARIESIPFRDRHSVNLPASAPSFNVVPFAPTLQSLSSLRIQLQESLAIFTSIADACDELSGLIDSCSPSSASVYRDKILKQVDHDLASASCCMKAIEFYTAFEMAQFEKPSCSDDKLALKDSAAIRSYLSIVQVASQQFVTMIGLAFDKISLRENELDEPYDVNRLVELWHADRTPGRVLMYADTHSPFFSEDHQSTVDEAIECYCQSLAESVSDERMSESRGCITNFVQSVLYLYSERNAESLQQIAKAMTDQNWPGNALVSLTEGLVNDLQSASVNALECYQVVVDLCASQLHTEQDNTPGLLRLLEESLFRMSQLYLKDDDAASAVDVMATLCEFCPHYIPSYAELLAVLGDVDNAVKLLGLYRENYPDDWRATRQLAGLLESNGSVEEARLAFSQAEEERQENNRPLRKVA